MDGLSVLKIIWTEKTVLDGCIFLVGILNLLIYFRARRVTKRLQDHFSKIDRMSALPRDSAENIRAVTGEASLMAPETLLECRDRMNKYYSMFSIITTMFPLLGLLGTVASLIPMVNSIGAEDVQLFFGALTSTFWGIVWALICKFFDIFIGYKVEDNEKRIEFLLNPKRTADEKRE